MNGFLSRFKSKIIRFHKESRFNVYFTISLVIFNIVFLILTLFFHGVYEENDGFIYYLYYRDLITDIMTPPIDAGYWPPGIPLLIGIVSLVIGDYFIAGKIIMVEFSILFLFSTHITVKKLFNEKVAFFTYLAVATNHFIILYYYFQLNSDIPFGAFLIFSIYFVIRDGNTITSKMNLVYSAIFLSLATLIRWTGLFLLPVILIKFLIDSYKVSEIKFLQKFKNFIKISITFFGVFFLILLPYLILNTIWFDTPFLIGATTNIYKGMHFDWRSLGVPEELSWSWFLFGPESDLFYQNLIKSFFKRNPFIFAKYLIFYYVDPIETIFNMSIIISIISILLFTSVFIGYFISYKIHKKEIKNSKWTFFYTTEFYIFIVILLYWLVISLAVIKMRYLFPIIPLLIAPLIFLIIKLLEKLGKFLTKVFLKIKKSDKKHFYNKKKISQYTSIVLITIVSLQFIVSINSASYQNSMEKVEYKVAGEKLRDMVEKDDVLALFHMNYIYYIGDLGYDIIRFPASDNLSYFFSFIKFADYIVICERIEAYKRPDLEFLLNASHEDVPNYFNVIYTNNKTDRRIVIYEILYEE